MKNKLLALLVVPFALCMSPLAASAELYEEDLNGSGSEKYWESAADKIALDTEDPMFLEKNGDFLFKTSAYMEGHFLHASERISVGLNSRIRLAVDLDYQLDFDDHESGFSGAGLDLAYRFNDGPFISDLYAGIKLSGSSHVPEFADNIWYGGARIGRQWSWVTLAVKAQTSWIFDEVRGMAYIDVMPEVYFRIYDGWSLGLNADLRKSTNPLFDREWLGARIAKRYGRTVYVGFTEYEIEQSEWKFGARLNLLF